MLRVGLARFSSVLKAAAKQQHSSSLLVVLDPTLLPLSTTTTPNITPSCTAIDIRVTAVAYTPWSNNDFFTLLASIALRPR